ncbi:HDR019Wp [Eremothecium sinecaudum]|uniref:HDR019Wp n=1 Tax=Eremothecium sinecaudum TaxID=45286 RepID=A0A109UZ41_9SACH|nr:HDR019Wp [Eremothecium sinecaudum]AMD20762.1 HDR019Wp [Eremothecium sinecaudum]
MSLGVTGHAILGQAAEAAVEAPSYGSYLPKIDQFYIPQWLTLSFVANNIISFTPLLSYGTTVWSISRSRTALGFSIDICATMLIASILRVSYYLISPYEKALLTQSLCMIFIQTILLYTSLYYRPEEYKFESLKPIEPFSDLLKDTWHEYFPVSMYGSSWKGFIKTADFNTLLGFSEKALLVVVYRFLKFFDASYQRVGGFWQWDDTKRFWKFLLWFFVCQFAGTYVISKVLGWESLTIWMGSIIGSLGLLIESLLPLPQISILHKLQSVQGFKLILLVSWLCGDILKITYLVFGASNISSMFVFFALFQMSLDMYIAFLYVYYKYYFPSKKRVCTSLIEMQEMLPTDA